MQRIKEEEEEEEEQETRRWRTKPTEISDNTFPYEFLKYLLQTE